MSRQKKTKETKTWIDPVQIFIDRQLAARWREHQLYKDVISKETKSWAWCPKESDRTPLYVSQTFSINTATIEDALIAALDKKYHGKDSRLMDEVELLFQGYKLQETADLLGLDRTTVWSDIRSWRGEDDDEEIKDIIRNLAENSDSEGFGY